MTSSRIRSYWTKWRTLAETYGDMCFYCHEEAATSIDHVLPYSYANNDDLDNLRLACGLCNRLASDKVFESLDEKRWYILGRRKYKGARHYACSECGVPFVYREQSPSLFLCPECYDLEYGTDYANRGPWHRWIELLQAAEMDMAIYRRAGAMYRSSGRRGQKWLNTCLVAAVRSQEAIYLAAEPQPEKRRSEALRNVAVNLLA